MKKLLLLTPLVLMLVSCDIQSVMNSLPDPTPIADETPTESPQNALTDDEMELKHLSASDKSVKTDSMNKIRGQEYDFDADGNMDTVSLYSNVEKDEDGKFLWDDFHQWVLEVEMSSGKYYTLFDNSISLGQLYFELSEIYNEDVTPAITTFMTSGSGLEIYQFSFEGQDFIERKIYSSSDNSTSGINKIYSSIPHYK